MKSEDQLLAFIMREHEEFHTYWENIEEFMDYEFDPDSEVNPFMHVMLHQMVEQQIRNESPPEVEKVFQRLKDGGMDRHGAIHLIGSVLVENLFDVVKNGQEFQMDRYLSELRSLPEQQ